jgi:hypothetical protein
MSQTKLAKLTPEQEALIPVYREKWRAIALATDPIDNQTLSQAVTSSYVAIGKAEPEVLIFDSPPQALNAINNQDLHLWFHLVKELNQALASQLDKQLSLALWGQLRIKLEGQLRINLAGVLTEQLEIILLKTRQTRKSWDKFNCCTTPKFLIPVCSRLDFCISVLNCAYDEQKWLALQSLVKYGGWVFPFEKTCVFCNLPIKISLDNQKRLHAEAEPAVYFADGSGLYAYHGVVLPDEYGKIHPHQWQSQWLINEDNAEIRRLLIQEIGYDRICQELQATELDKYQGYTLVKIDGFIDNIDQQPIYLLKMICPSTGFIHALRVPPNISSARIAIRWVNWGIDPEKFSVQT